jgi:hypothetical protein
MAECLPLQEQPWAGIPSSVTARASAKLDGILEYSARIRIGNRLQHQFAVPHRNPITENGDADPRDALAGFLYTRVNGEGGGNNCP